MLTKTRLFFTAAGIAGALGMVAGCAGSGPDHSSNANPYLVAFERAPNQTTQVQAPGFPQANIWTCDGDGNNLQQITNGIEFSGNPTIAANGSLITFERFENGVISVYSIFPDGTGETKLTTVNSFSASVNATGTKIVYVSDTDGDADNEIWVMNADGTSKTKLTDNTVSDTNPTFNHAGNRIVFQSFRDGEYEIYTINLDGSNATRLTANEENETQPQYSPDDSLIVYTRADSSENIYVMDADGSNQTQLTTSANNDFQPTFSPDGLYIYYTTGLNDFHIQRMTANGADSTAITNSSSNDFHPSVISSNL